MTCVTGFSTASYRYRSRSFSLPIVNSLNCAPVPSTYASVAKSGVLVGMVCCRSPAMCDCSRRKVVHHRTCVSRFLPCGFVIVLLVLNDLSFWTIGCGTWQKQASRSSWVVVARRRSSACCHLASACCSPASACCRPASACCSPASACCSPASAASRALASACRRSCSCLIVSSQDIADSSGYKEAVATII